MNKKYLGEIIKEEGIELGTNTLIVSPVGSGKTFYILNDLIQGKKCLYLCDNGNLRDSVKQSINEEKLNGLMNDVTVMCYASFGKIVKNDTLNNFINQFDIIVCDEIHNLIDYQGIDDSANLLVARIKLFDRYDNTQIVFFTATPYYLDRLAKENEGVSAYFTRHDFSTRKDIKRYIDKRLAYINHYSDVEKTFKEYDEYFKYRNGKCLMYTEQVSVMKNLHEIALKSNLNPICIWSTNAKEEMNEEQLKVREHLINTGELLAPYNVLIINRATETGVNIYDKDIELVIVNTTNLTQQTQARGRIRHDIELLVLKTKDQKQVEFNIDDDLLDQWLYKATVEEFVIHKNNLRNRDGKLIGMKALVTRLYELGYILESKRRKVSGKLVTQYKITKR